MTTQEKKVIVDAFYESIGASTLPREIILYDPTMRSVSKRNREVLLKAYAEVNKAYNNYRRKVVVENATEHLYNKFVGES